MSAALPGKTFRITRRGYARTTREALSGNGGLYEAGRWHSKGRRILYTSQSATLCLLERMVHADEWIAERHPDRVLLTLSIPDVSFLAFDEADLSGRDPNWRLEGNGFCRRLGDLWLHRASSCGLVVPSAASPSDFNILFNPLHSEFATILAANDPLTLAPVQPDERVVSLVQARRGAPKSSP